MVLTGFPLYPQAIATLGTSLYGVGSELSGGGKRRRKRSKRKRNKLSKRRTRRVKGKRTRRCKCKTCRCKPCKCTKRSSRRSS